MNLLLIYKAATLWTFPWPHGVFHIIQGSFFYKKPGLICKLVLWLVQFSTLLSDKPKHWNILAKSRQILLTVTWTVSVLRWRRWESVQTGQTPDLLQEMLGCSSWKLWRMWALSCTVNTGWCSGSVKPGSSQSLFFQLLHFLICFYFI